MRNYSTIPQAFRLTVAVFIAVAASLQDPVSALAQGPSIDLDRGEEIYAHSCSVCHGENGDAKSWAQNSLYPPPRNFRSVESKELTRLAMMTALRKGIADTAMVSFKTQLSESDMESVISYIRLTFMDKDDSLWLALGIPESEAPFPLGLHGDFDKGKIFFYTNCAECHGRSGKGDGRRAYFINPKPADLTSEKMRVRLNRPALFRAISDGVRQKEMPAWSKVLSEQEIANVGEYVFSAFIYPSSGSADSHAEDPPSKN